MNERVEIIIQNKIFKNKIIENIVGATICRSFSKKKKKKKFLCIIDGIQ